MKHLRLIVLGLCFIIVLLNGLFYGFIAIFALCYAHGFAFLTGAGQAIVMTLVASLLFDYFRKTAAELFSVPPPISEPLIIPVEVPEEELAPRKPRRRGK